MSAHARAAHRRPLPLPRCDARPLETARHLRLQARGRRKFICGTGAVNTSATLWRSAAVGAGTDMVAEAAMVTVFVLDANTLPHPLVDLINRAPENVKRGEARCEVMVTTTVALPQVRRRLIGRLAEAHYPVNDFEVIARGEERVEIMASLIPTAVVGAELDAVAADIDAMTGVVDVTWKRSELE